MRKLNTSRHLARRNLHAQMYLSSTRVYRNLTYAISEISNDFPMVAQGDRTGKFVLNTRIQAASFIYGAL